MRWLRVVGAVARRPQVWGAAVVQARRLAPNRWWARWPFLPLPDRAWVAFRMKTAYGHGGPRVPRPEDVVAWLDWCRQWDRLRYSRHR